MIISHRHKFIFIKTRKTAGTSLQAALERICGPEDVVTPTGITDSSYVPRNYRGFSNPFSYLSDSPRRHSPGRILRRTAFFERYFDHMLLHELVRLPEYKGIADYRTFCIERNPWDKCASYYFWRTRNMRERPSFSDFLKKGKILSDFDFYSRNGAVAVDFVGRYEDLQESVAAISNLVGCDIRLEDAHNTSSRRTRDYRPLYSPETKSWVEKHFSREIECLNYRFDCQQP